MYIRKLQSGDEKALRRFLLPKWETSLFMLGNMEKSGLDYQAQTFQGEYLAAFSSANNIEAVAVHYWTGIIMVQASSSSVLLDLLVEFKTQITRPVLGVVGDADYSAQTVEALGLSAKPFALYDSEDIYSMSLDALSFNPPPASQPYRLCSVCDIDAELLAQWYKAYDIEALNMDDDGNLQQRVKKSLEERAEREQWVLRVNNEPVSLSGFNARTTDVVQIGPVWTPPPQRNKGYARMLVAWTLLQARHSKASAAARCRHLR